MTDSSNIHEALDYCQAAREYLEASGEAQLLPAVVYLEAAGGYIARWLVDSDLPAYAGEEV